MAANTKKFNFKKPDESDFYSIQDQNGNWDKAEDALDDLYNPAFEDYTGGTTVPSADAALGAMKSRSKISALLANIKAFCKGCCTLAMIVNNCVTNNPKLPLSAAQGKALMDLFTQLNSDKVNKSDMMISKHLANATIGTGFTGTVDLVHVVACPRIVIININLIKNISIVNGDKLAQLPFGCFRAFMASVVLLDADGAQSAAYALAGTNGIVTVTTSATKARWVRGQIMVLMDN